MFRMTIKNGTVQCEKAEDVFKTIKEFSDNETFWDDVINDEVGEDFYAFGDYYKPAAILKALNREKFDSICKPQTRMKKLTFLNLLYVLFFINLFNQEGYILHYGPIFCR